MAAPKKSPRPKANPNRSPDFGDDRTGGLKSDLAPEKSPVPKRNPRRKAMGGPVKGYAKGGKCRGMGAAKRGGSYKAM